MTPGAATRKLDITAIFRDRGPKRPRRTAAGIMFADMVGFSVLMQRDERAALEARAAYRAALEEAVDGAGGVVVQHYGDGALSIFRRAQDATEAAHRIQRHLRHRTPGVEVRIGVHFDDIVRDGEGVYGHGVNVAARIQSLSTPGSVLLSDRVALELRGRSQSRLQPMGTFQLKNIAEPMLIHALDDPDVDLPTPGRLSSTSAVLISPPGRPTPPGPPHGLVATLLWEVKRRRVHRVALGYCTFAILLIALAELVAGTASVPDVLVDAATTLALVGFVPAVVLAWIFDLAPGWLVVTPPGPGFTRSRQSPPESCEP